MGYARRIRLPIPVFRPMACERIQQVGGGIGHVDGSSAGLELLFSFERLVLAGTKE